MGWLILGNLSLYGNLLSFVPNVANLPRDVIVAETGQDAGFKYSTIYNVGRNPYCGLDLTIYNNSGSTAIIAIDTRQYWVLDGSVRTITNIPYNEMQIISTGATANQIDLTFFGTSLDYLKELGLGNPNMTLNMGDLA